MLILGPVAQLGQSTTLRTSGTGVQIPPGPPRSRRRRSSVDQSTGFRNQGPRVQIPPAPPTILTWVGSQVVWQRAFNPLTVSSILTRPTSRVKHGSVTQLAEYPVLTRDVVGSMPTGSTKRKIWAGSSVIEHMASTHGVASSSLARPSMPSRQRRSSRVAQRSERPPYKGRVTSSNLVPTTRRLCLESGRIQRKGHGSVAQAGRAPVSKTGGCGFEAHSACHFRW